MKPLSGIDHNSILTPSQAAFLKSFVKTELARTFRFTGGTALSAFYLGHRLSEDLDFFADQQIPFYVCEGFLKTLPMVLDITFTKLHDRNIFLLSLQDTSSLKVEFTYYPLKNLEKVHVIDGLLVDGFLDLVVNKLCAIADRTDPKDYVDLYWSLNQGGLLLETLTELAEKKCEISGIRHILKNRLLQIPAGIENLPLKIAITTQEIETLFRELIKKMIEKEVRARGSYNP